MAGFHWGKEKFQVRQASVDVLLDSPEDLLPRPGDFSFSINEFTRLFLKGLPPLGLAIFSFIYHNGRLSVKNVTSLMSIFNIEFTWMSLRTTSRPRIWSKTACMKGSDKRINFNLSRCHNMTRDSSHARMLTCTKSKDVTRLRWNSIIIHWQDKKKADLEKVVRWDAKPFRWVEKLHRVENVKRPAVLIHEHA